MNILINIILFILIFLIYNKLTDNKKIDIKSKKTIIIFIFLTVSNIITNFVANEYNNYYITSFLCNISLITIYKIFIDKYNISKEVSYKNCFIFTIIGLSISFILETTLFNYHHYESINYQKQNLTNITLDENIIKENGVLKVKEYGKYSIEITDINQKINNIYIDIKNNTNKYNPYNVVIQATDEANSEYFTLPSISISEKINKSLYHKLHLSGKSEKIKLDVTLTPDFTYTIKEISINVPVPLEINIARICLLTFIIVIYFIFNPKSLIYKTTLLEYKKKNIAIIFFVIIEIIGCSMMFFSNLHYMKYDIVHHHQYQDLAHSLKKGKLSLDYPASDEFLDLSNPYDTNLRINLNLEANDDYVWDTSFYKGKYYVYFGVVPVVIAYLPYHLITGNDLENYHLVYVMGILTIMSFVYLVYQIIKKWFSKTSLGMFLLLSMLLINSSGLLILFKCHDLYSVPIIFSLFFVSLGIGLWISAYNKTNNNQNILKLCIGSFCMALVAGCRPQFIIASFLIFPIFIAYFKKGKLITKRKIKELCFLLIPYIIVALPLMLYNYFRFGSIFNFGVIYNLTTNDMTKRGFVLERIFPGIYYLLIALPSVKPTFPFLNAQTVQTTYLGNTISEYMFGGFLTCNLICIVNLFLPKFKKIFDNKDAYNIALLSSIISIIIVIVDAEMAGILNRYTCDFGWLLIMSTIITLSTLNIKNNNKEYFLKTIIILIFTSTLFSFGSAILDKTYSIQEITPTLYEQIKYLLCFWL